MKTLNWIATLSCLMIVLTSVGCSLFPDDADIFEITCAAFDPEELRYFPYELLDSVEYVDESDTLFRKFYVAGSAILEDTTIRVLEAGAECISQAEYLMLENINPRTTINFFINQIDDVAGEYSLGINFSDVGAFGSPYFQRFQVSPEVSGELNTLATELDSLVIDTTTYTNVIVAELLSDPDPADQYFNDVRKLWVTKGAGIIQFEDEDTGIWRLRR